MLQRVWVPPADKSLSHRALIFASLSKGVSQLSNFLQCQDTYATLQALRNLGVQIEEKLNRLTVIGKGLKCLKAPVKPLDCRNSGTTLRLLTGLLSMQPFSTVLTGDESLRKRPMKELVGMLTQMGANITYLIHEGVAPLKIHPVQFKKVDSLMFEPSIPSAQVKSALLLAGLYCKTQPLIKESIVTRDHTERILKRWQPSFEAFDMTLPGDFSSAAFMMALTLLCPKSSLRIERVGLNPTRTGFLEVLKQMGAQIHTQLKSDEFEPQGVIQVRHQGLVGTFVEKEKVIKAIDEIPLVALLATQAKGITRVKDAKMLRTKECDRIAAICQGLKAMGAHIEERDDGFKISGPTDLKGAKVSSFGDHRIAMMLTLASKIAKGKVEIDDLNCIDVSFPKFIETTEALCQGKN